MGRQRAPTSFAGRSATSSAQGLDQRQRARPAARAAGAARARLHGLSRGTLAPMTSFDLRQVEAPPGRGAPRGARARAAARSSSAASATSRCPRLVPAELVITRALTGTVFALAFDRAAPRPVLPLPRRRRARPPDPRPRVPGLDARRRGADARRTSTTTCSTSPPGRATRSRSRCPTRSSAGPTAPGSARVRQEPERGAARRTRRSRRPALGRARGAPRRDLLAVRFGYSCRRSWPSRRGKPPSRGATSAGRRTRSRRRG